MTTTELFAAFAEIADTLGEDLDNSAYLQSLTARSVQLMDITAAGALLTDEHGDLRRGAASSREAHLLQQFQVQTGHGPSMDCFRTGRSIDADDLRTDDRWPDLAVSAAAAGFTAVHAVAMRHRAQTIGALSFFTARPGPLDPNSRDTGQALSDIATIGLLHREGLRSREIRVVQLQTALNSRILIEQAKGILAERLGLSVSEAFSLLRQYARSHNRRLREVAQGIVDATEQFDPPTTEQLTPPTMPGNADRPTSDTTRQARPD